MPIMITDVSQPPQQMPESRLTFSTDNLPGSDCPEAVLGPRMINSTTVLNFWIAIFVHRESTAVCHSLKKRLWARKEGRIICNESVMSNKSA